MKALVYILVLWLPFSVAAVVAVFVSLAAILREDWVYAKDVLRAMDKLGAAVLGWSGMYTVSAECGVSECRFCKVICALLNRIDPWHCRGAAINEGLTSEAQSASR